MKSNTDHCCASIYLNKKCLYKQRVPTYAKIKIPHTSPAATITMKKAQIIRIKEEIRLHALIGVRFHSDS
jgi:hypothetical protein